MVPVTMKKLMMTINCQNILNFMSKNDDDDYDDDENAANADDGLDSHFWYAGHSVMRAL